MKKESKYNLIAKEYSSDRKGFKKFYLKKIEFWRWEGRGQDRMKLSRQEAIGYLSAGVRFWRHCVGWQG